MKTVFKLSIIFMVVILQLISMPTIVKADSIFSSADVFVSKGKGEADKELKTDVLKKGNATIYNVLLGIGVALAVIIGAILGIRFMASSVEGKAQIKELLVPYIVGCVVVFGAFGIWKIATEIGDSIKEGTSTQIQEEQLQETKQKNYDDIKDIESGKVKVQDLSDSDLMKIYRANNIDGNLNEAVNGSRNRNKKTLSQAVSDLSSAQKQVYEEAYRRGLLKDDGIYLK